MVSSTLDQKRWISLLHVSLCLSKLQNPERECIRVSEKSITCCFKGIAPRAGVGAVWSGQSDWVLQRAAPLRDLQNPHKHKQERTKQPNRLGSRRGQWHSSVRPKHTESLTVAKYSTVYQRNFRGFHSFWGNGVDTGLGSLRYRSPRSSGFWYSIELYKSLCESADNLGKKTFVENFKLKLKMNNCLKTGINFSYVHFICYCSRQSSAVFLKCYEDKSHSHIFVLREKYRNFLPNYCWILFFFSLKLK